MTYNGYNIQVKGYASSVGSAALNQQLSEERANNVTNILHPAGSCSLDQHAGAGSHGREPPGRQ